MRLYDVTVGFEYGSFISSVSISIESKAELGNKTMYIVNAVMFVFDGMLFLAVSGQSMNSIWRGSGLSRLYITRTQLMR